MADDCRVPWSDRPALDRVDDDRYRVCIVCPPPPLSPTPIWPGSATAATPSLSPGSEGGSSSPSVVGGKEGGWGGGGGGTESYGRSLGDLSFTVASLLRRYCVQPKCSVQCYSYRPGPQPYREICWGGKNWQSSVERTPTLTLPYV